MSEKKEVSHLFQARNLNYHQKYYNGGQLRWSNNLKQRTKLKKFENMDKIRRMDKFINKKRNNSYDFRVRTNNSSRKSVESDDKCKSYEARIFKSGEFEKIKKKKFDFLTNQKPKRRNFESRSMINIELGEIKQQKDVATFGNINQSFFTHIEEYFKEGEKWLLKSLKSKCKRTTELINSFNQNFSSEKNNSHYLTPIDIEQIIHQSHDMIEIGYFPSSNNKIPKFEDILVGYSDILK